MDIFKDRILPLIEKSGLNDAQIEKALNLPRSTIYDWKHGRSKSYKKNISDIASLFHVSTDYLLGNTNIKAPSTYPITFDDFTVAMHNQSGRLTEEQKQQLLKMAELFAKDNEGK